MDPAAAIFDMDGLLIDSEPLWREAERAAFAAAGLHLSDADCEITMGLRTDDVVAYWYERAGWSGTAPADVAVDILRRMDRLIGERGQALPGVYATVRQMRASGLGTALASSSPPALIDAVLAKLGLGADFDVLCSGVDEERGKPDPAVFLTAARRLGVEPGRCVVFEDSIAGVRAGLAAGMIVVAVPAPNLAADPAFSEAHLKLGSLVPFTLEKLASAGLS